MASRVEPGFQLLTVPEVAERLCVSQRTVRRLIADGQLRPARIERRVLVTQRELDAFVAHIESEGRRQRW